MCSIATNATADKQLNFLKNSGDEKRVEKKLRDFAADSSIKKEGILDSTANHIYGMPADLKHIRRIRTGRHRVFYLGHHSQCSYKVFYIKVFKKKGEKNELDTQFHRILRGAVADSSTVRAIRPSDATTDKPCG